MIFLVVKSFTKEGVYETKRENEAHPSFPDHFCSGRDFWDGGGGCAEVRLGTAIDLGGTTSGGNSLDFLCGGCLGVDVGDACRR